MCKSDRLAKLHMLPCVVCHLMGMEQTSHTEAHHLHHLPNGYKFKVGMRRADHEFTIPLCAKKHHWNGVHNKGDWCLSTFEAHVGKTEPELWAITNQMLLELE